VQGAFGEAGSVWLDKLPQTLDTMAERWALTLEAPYKDPSYNFVVPGQMADGLEIVLKLAVSEQELRHEILVLRAFNGRGMAEVIESEAKAGALLLERIIPGRAIVELDDDEKSTLITCRLIRHLQEVDAHALNMPKVESWGRGFARHRAQYAGGSGPIKESMLAKAEGLFSELSASTEKEVLLHGDLHHWNILSAKRQPWLAIDPKGVVGDPAYEAGAWLRNPVTAIQAGDISEVLLARRVDHFVNELSFERSRVIGWAFAQALLAACWSFEDGDKNGDLFLAWADLLSKLK
jgi:streptomycin 6-kinase